MPYTSNHSLDKNTTQKSSSFNRYITKRVALIIIGVGWAIGSAFAMIPMFWNNWETATMCEFNEILPLWYVVGVITPAFTLVWMCMLILYWRIWREASKHAKQLRSSFSGVQDTPPSDWKSVQVWVYIWHRISKHDINVNIFRFRWFCLSWDVFHCAGFRTFLFRVHKCSSSSTARHQCSTKVYFHWQCWTRPSTQSSMHGRTPTSVRHSVGYCTVEVPTTMISANTVIDPTTICITGDNRH